MIKKFQGITTKYQTKSGGDGNQSPHCNPNMKGASVCSKAVSGLGANSYTNAGSKGKTVGSKLQ